ncbi:MAG: DUF493 domain-containing protein [Chlorobi bacterium]|nr:DUF493 domain-containing protein [Chlorobiota bacterium]
MDEQNKKPIETTSKEEFYKRLEEELNKNHTWPTRYMYKFIVPNEEAKIEEVKKRFEKEYDFKQNFSRSGKYVSLTFITTEDSPESIINQYKKMEDIEGLIAI